MTNQRINLNESFLLYAFSSEERNHIHLLTEKVNQLAVLMANKEATKEQKQEYYSLKWILKQSGAIDSSNLEKVINEN